MSRSKLLRLLTGVVLLGAIALAVIYRAEIPAAMDRLLDWVRELGWWGPIVVVIVYIAACVLFVPGWAITIIAGIVFGLGLGFVTVSIGSVLGCAAAFLVGRYVARDAIEAKIAGNRRFDAVASAVRDRGFLIVFLVRLSPVFPFNLLNYAFGLTRVSFRDYFFASWIGMIPGTVLYVYIGSALSDLAAAEDREKTLAEQMFRWGGLAVTFVVTVIVTRIARKALADAAPSAVSTGEKPDRTAGSD